ncbi:TPA: replication initiation factor domain-containing protein [Bacillus thuringiensis]|uniref:replication initiation factor domain-containing protein n=1 Tax=Bacillus cereus group TaxID=86661 RepID=UPI0015A2AD6F|nr:replication initiation factor domain-containing protein [Bacillus thuringiensis]MCU5220562.1 replication initiation factor domain-containing protein [Bacillus cereus]MCC3976734.1 replication initiation factor domain-containing protein [Bacillus thuringiensis]MCC3995496.1 replication initiation factor domain-containing protein [Bacillus thuringiensis]MCC4007819.1 replication initiation factor domain-containing protein [Bacillus thuringiensis serovar kurstaki]MCU5265289.1 replication initiati
MEKHIEKLSLSVCVDWLEFTFVYGEEFESICSFLGLDSTVFSKEIDGFHKSYGYLSRYSFEEIHILMHGADNRSRIIMSGSGCRWFETLSSVGWYGLFDRIAFADEHGFSWIKVDRLDIAIDDFVGYFSVKKLKSKIKRRECLSRWKTSFVVETFDLEQGRLQGSTIYFGSASSKLRWVVYDKLEEQKKKNKDSDSIQGLEFWTRHELRLKKERADRAVKQLVVNDFSIEEMYFGIINNYISFRVVDKEDSNRNRWNIAPFWRQYIGQASKLRLAEALPVANVERTFKWLSHSVSKKLYLLSEIFSQDDDTKKEFASYLENKGKQKITKGDLDLIENFPIRDFKEFLKIYNEKCLK